MGAGGLGDGSLTGEGKVVNEWWLEEEGQGWEKELMWKVNQKEGRQRKEKEKMWNMVENHGDEQNYH